MYEYILKTKLVSLTTAKHSSIVIESHISNFGFTKLSIATTYILKTLHVLSVKLLCLVTI